MQSRRLYDCARGRAHDLALPDKLAAGFELYFLTANSAGARRIVVYYHYLKRGRFLLLDQ